MRQWKRKKEIDYERFYGSCFTIYNYWISVVIIIVNNKKNKSKESYICEGMCFGMSFGLLLGTSFSSEHLGLFLSMGIY